MPLYRVFKQIPVPFHATFAVQADSPEAAQAAVDAQCAAARVVHALPTPTVRDVAAWRVDEEHTLTHPVEAVTEVVEVVSDLASGDRVRFAVAGFEVYLLPDGDDAADATPRRVPIDTVGIVEEIRGADPAGDDFEILVSVNLPLPDGRPAHGIVYSAGIDGLERLGPGAEGEGGAGAPPPGATLADAPDRLAIAFSREAAARTAAGVTYAVAGYAVDAATCFVPSETDRPLTFGLADGPLDAASGAQPAPMPATWEAPIAAPAFCAAVRDALRAIGHHDHATFDVLVVYADEARGAETAHVYGPPGLRVLVLEDRTEDDTTHCDGVVTVPGPDGRTGTYQVGFLGLDTVPLPTPAAASATGTPEAPEVQS